MRLHSTPASVDRRELSLLAIIESIFAIALSLWIAVHFQTLGHIAVGACVAPFLLLSTRWSRSLALHFFDDDKLGKKLLYPLRQLITKAVAALNTAISRSGRYENRAPYLIVVFLVVAGGCAAIIYAIALLDAACNALVMLVARIGAVAYAFAKHPSGTLGSLPTNWSRFALCIDIAHPPEVLPGIETHPSDVEEFRFSGKWASLSKLFLMPPFIAKSRTVLGAWAIVPHSFYLIVRLLHATIASFFFAIQYLPSVVYRLSLKSTSIIYIPLIFIINSRIQDQLSGTEYAEDTRFGGLEKAAFTWSCFIVAANLLCAILLWEPLVLLHSAYVDGGAAGRLLLELFVPTDGVKLVVKGWHIASFLNSLVAIWLFFYADQSLRRLNHGRVRDEEVRQRFRACRIVQVGLTSYTTFCAIKIVAGYVWWQKIPPIEFRLIP